MRAVVYERFGQRPEVRDLPVPHPSRAGVVVRVEATGLCRSDRHAWQGHDGGIVLPHVPGHEFVGHVSQTGPDVRRFRVGDRVTTPFVCACGDCPECVAGAGQVCRNQTQPGFTHHGSFAEYVAVHHADVNLIAVAPGLDAGAAALLGCRFATAYRGLAHRARLRAGEWLAVFGCGGVGLSSVMIGVACGARVVGIDVSETALASAEALGAEHTLKVASDDDVAERVRALTGGGAHVTVDALGRGETVASAIRSLRPLGRHVQIGLLPDDPGIPLDAVVAGELSLFGSHGMAAADYGELVDLVTADRLRPSRLITRIIDLEAACDALVDLASTPGVTLIRP